MKTCCAALIVSLCWHGGSLTASAQTQSAVTTDNLSLRETLIELTREAGSSVVGNGLFLATVLEINTAALVMPPTGFTTADDPVTGGPVKTVKSFGPSFLDGATTIGAGQIVTAAGVTALTFDNLGSASLQKLRYATLNAGTAAARTGYASLALTAQTTNVMAAIGATDRLELGVVVPIMKIELKGTSWLEDPTGKALVQSEGAALSSGLGDVAVRAKVRLLRFGRFEAAKKNAPADASSPDTAAPSASADSTPVDLGGVAASLVIRLPTGDRDNLRGLGLTRTLAAISASRAFKKTRGHVNVGYEWWSDGIDVPGDPEGRTVVTARDLLQFGAGIEVEATPKLTLLLEGLGRQVRGGGRVGFASDRPSPNAQGIVTREVLVGLPSELSKLAVAPGFKWNVKGDAVIALNLLIPVNAKGMRDRFTPVAGLNWKF